MNRLLALLAIPALISCGSSTGPSVDTSIKEGTVALGALVRDVAYDSKRNTLYLSQPAAVAALIARAAQGARAMAHADWRAT